MLFLFLFGFVRQFLCNPGYPGTLCRPDWPWTQKPACFCLLSARIKATVPRSMPLKSVFVLVYVCAFWFCLFCGASSNPGACWGSSTHWITFPAPIFPFLLWKKDGFTRTLLKIMSSVLKINSMKNHGVSWLNSGTNFFQ